MIYRNLNAKLAVAGLLVTGLVIAWPMAVALGANLGGPGDGCTDDYSCAVGLFCDSGHNMTCQPGVAGTDCSQDNSVCQTGLMCDGKQCIQNNGVTGPQDPQKYPVPGRDECPVGSGQTCPIGKPTSPIASCNTSDPAQIAKIQQIVAVTVTNVCDDNTKAGIQIWQNRKGLTDDGNVGPNTSSAMGLTTSSGTGTGSGTGAGTGSGNQTPSSGQQGNCPTPLVQGPGGVCMPPNNCTGSICKAQDLPSLLVTVINILLSLAGAIAVVFIIIGGFWYVTSAGNEEQAEKGRKALINSIIGVVIIILSYAIVTVIGNLVSK